MSSTQGSHLRVFQCLAGFCVSLEACGARLVAFSRRLNIQAGKQKQVLTETGVDGARLAPKFILDPDGLRERLQMDIVWDDRMASRKTASFGVPYNYTGPASGISYSEVPLPSYLQSLCQEIFEEFSFRPNSCLVNFYPDGHSTLGFHSDQIDRMELGSGICIVSLGSERVIRFKKIAQPDMKHDITLTPGSALLMTRENQQEWKHGIPKAPTCGPRMSLTFRRLIPL